MQKVTECLILSEGSYCVFVPQSFVTKCLLIFIVDEVKNFAANNLLLLSLCRALTLNLDRKDSVETSVEL